MSLAQISGGMTHCTCVILSKVRVGRAGTVEKRDHDDCVQETLCVCACAHM